jgi:hypothetical protein
MGLREVQKRIEDCEVGETIDLEPWFRETYTSSWLESIEDAFEKWNEEYWHDEDNSACEESDDSDCTCPEPDPGKVAAGRVWDFVKSEYVEIKSLELSDSKKWVTVQIGFEEDGVPAELSRLPLDVGTLVRTGDYEEDSDQQEKTRDVSSDGPLQPPKDFFKGLVLEDKGPDLPKSSFATRDLTWG